MVGGAFQITYKIDEHSRIGRLTLTFVKSYDMRRYKRFAVLIDLVFQFVHLSQVLDVFIREHLRRHGVKLFQLGVHGLQHFQKLSGKLQIIVGVTVGIFSNIVGDFTDADNIVVHSVQSRNGFFLIYVGSLRGQRNKA